MNIHRLKKRALILLAFCLALACNPVVASATAEPAVSPAPSVASPSEPTPTIDVKELLESNELPDYGIFKEGDSGDTVLLIQKRLRDLGYFTYRETSEFGSMTKEAVKRFQRQNGLDVDGVVGGQTAFLLFENYADRAAAFNARIPTPTPPPVRKTGKLIEWSKVKSMTKRGDVYTVIDYYGGEKVTYKMVRVGGYNHMDVEPRTKKDCDTFKKTYGGSWSWSRRPVLVRIGGTYYAASINGMPHGYETVSGNSMTGQVCIHFLNSRTHGSNAVDSAHQRCVRTAAGK